MSRKRLCYRQEHQHPKLLTGMRDTHGTQHSVRLVPPSPNASASYPHPVTLTVAAYGPYVSVHLLHQLKTFTPLIPALCYPAAHYLLRNLPKLQSK